MIIKVRQNRTILTGFSSLWAEFIDKYRRVSSGLIAFLKAKKGQGVFTPCPCSQYLIFSSPNEKMLGYLHLCHTVIHKPAKCKNTPNQYDCTDQPHNHSSSCFRLINEWSCSDGTDCRAAKNDPLKVRQMDRTAADNCGIGNHKKNGAKQIEQDADHISLLHELPSCKLVLLSA